MNTTLESWHEEVGHVQRMVNAFERFHKSAQLIGTPLFIPILNESRYLSRALTDALFWITASDETPLPDGVSSRGKCIKDALSRARLAASSALHDTVDEILAITVRSLLLYEEELKKLGVSAILPNYLDEEWLGRYSAYLHAYRRIANKISDSRSKRYTRENVYLEILESGDECKTGDLEIVIDFFIRLRELEVQIFTSPRLSEVAHTEAS